MNDIITGEINKLLEKGVIVDSEAESEEVISPIFLREKSEFSSGGKQGGE